MLERSQSTQQQARETIANGGVVIYWRPGCPFCERLDAHLGALGDEATWVNIWEDPQAEAHVQSLNDGNSTVPTVDTGDISFVAASDKLRERTAKLLRNVIEGKQAQQN